MELVFVNNFTPRYDNYEKVFLRLLKKTQVTLKLNENILVEVNLVASHDIQEINKIYRKKNHPTDVISFAFDDNSPPGIGIKNAPFHHLGLIIISVDKAIAQAKEYGHTLNRELKFLFIHGLLHLCGYDHITPEKEAIMFELQDKIIGKRKKV